MSIFTTPQSTGSRESIGQPGRYTSSTKDAGGSMSAFRKAANLYIYMVSKVKRAHPGRELNFPVFFTSYRCCLTLCERLQANPSTNRRQPRERVAPNIYGGSAVAPCGAATVKVAPHAQEVIAYQPAASQKDSSTPLAGTAGPGRRHSLRSDLGPSGRLSSCVALGGRATSSS